MRLILLLCLAVAGCSSDTDVAPDAATTDLPAPPDLARADMACPPALGPAPSTSTPCGPVTCGPGTICVVHQPGIFFELDAGTLGSDPFDRSCAPLPSECQTCGGCGDITDFGCFSHLCRSFETGCRFDGSSLTCIGQ